MNVTNKITKMKKKFRKTKKIMNRNNFFLKRSTLYNEIIEILIQFTQN